MRKKITKWLVASVSEIAIRVLGVATELEIAKVAIYTSEDCYSLHRYKVSVRQKMVVWLKLSSSPIH